MKYLFSCIVLLAIFLVTGCNNKTNNEEKAKPKTNPNRVDSIPYFSFSGFFRGEIDDVLSTPYFMYEISSVNGKKDSIVLSKEAFKNLAQEFYTKDVSIPAVKENYKEDVFDDLSTKSITLNYSTLDKDLEIQGASVLIDDETNKVKRIFINTTLNKGDSTVNTHYNWKSGKSFLISRSITKKDGTNRSEQYLVNWNDASK